MEIRRPIWIMDDDAAGAEHLRALLAPFFDASIMGSLEEVLSSFEKSVPALILLSYAMESEDPLDVLEEIKDHPAGGDIPILMVTGAGVSKADEAQILGGGAADFIRDDAPNDAFLSKARKLTCVSDEYLIDEKAAIAYCGSREVFLEVALTFVTIAPEDAEKIALAAKEPDLKDYTVRVHGLKNAAKVVGALRLSEDAARLEQRGKAEDRDAVTALTAALLALYDRCAEELKGIIA